MAVKLKAEKRSDLKHSSTKALREKGLLPAVVYGKEQEALNVTVDNMELLKTLRDEGRNAVIGLDLDGSVIEVMLHDYQSEPIRNELIHADFYVVDMTQEMDVMVSVHTTGESKGEKEGGVLQHPLYEIEVRAKPADIPDEIVVDVSALEIGDSITVADLKADAKYEILEDEHSTIATVTAPDVIEDDEDDAEDEDVEPELVDQKGSSDEDEDSNE